MVISKKTKLILIMFMIVIVTIGCSNENGTSSESEKDSSENESALESEDETNETEKDHEEKESSGSSTTESEEAATDLSDNTSLEESNGDGNKEDKELSDYSSKEIEYARVWLEIGANQEIDELNVRHIQAGEPINPDDDTSANYPEDVIQLSGSRLVDGSVTYSGNGDGTINVYNVPLRWDSNELADVDEDYMKEYTESIIEGTELVKINPGDNDEIIKLINIMKIH